MNHTNKFWVPLAVFLSMTTTAFGDKADEYARRGDAKEAKGDWKGAIGDFSKAIRLRPDFAVAYNNRGSAMERAYRARRRALGFSDMLSGGYLDAAIADFTKAIEIDPDFAGAYSNRGNAKMDKSEEDRLALTSHGVGLPLERIRNLDEAIADFSRAIEINPSSASFRLHDWFNVEIDMRTAYSVAYDMRGFARVDVYISRGETGDLDGAIVDFTKAVEIDPGAEYAYANRGCAKQAKGDMDGAIADYNRAIQLKPGLALAYYYRGIAKQAKGDRDGAAVDRARANRLNPAVMKLDGKVAYVSNGHY